MAGRGGGFAIRCPPRVIGQEQPPPPGNAGRARRCPSDGLGVRAAAGGGLISAEHSCWSGRKRERCVVCSVPEPVGREGGLRVHGAALETGCSAAAEGRAVGGKGTVTFRERALPRDCLVGAGRFGDLIRSAEVGGGNLFNLPVTAAA